MKKIKHFLWEFGRLILLPLLGLFLVTMAAMTFVGVHSPTPYQFPQWVIRGAILGGFVLGWFLGQTAEKDGQGIHF